jgi:hypothetical protein
VVKEEEEEEYEYLAISPAWFSPFLTGKPDTTMYASPIVSTWGQCYD